MTVAERLLDLADRINAARFSGYSVIEARAADEALLRTLADHLKPDSDDLRRVAAAATAVARAIASTSNG